MSDPAGARNIFFPLTVLFSGLFVVTILALVAVLFGDPQAPIALMLDRAAGWLIVVEVAGILISGLLALTVDRRQTLAAQLSESRHDESHSGGN